VMAKRNGVRAAFPMGARMMSGHNGFTRTVGARMACFCLIKKSAYLLNYGIRNGFLRY